MIRSICCPTLNVALAQLGKTVKTNEIAGVRTVVFCEDRLSLAAERAICSATEGTFLASAYTFSRFLAAHCGKQSNVLSAQGSAMAVRRIIEENRDKLTMFGRLSAPSSAQAVYDTIALLYSSRVSPDDIKTAVLPEGNTAGKLADIALVYEKYKEYLDENGLQDRNGYLRRLASAVSESEITRGAHIVFLGFQAFTRAAMECVISAFECAQSVDGLFIYGEEDIYVKEAKNAFVAAAAEYGGAVPEYVEGKLSEESEILRRTLFNPESFFRKPVITSRVHIFEARDEEEEFEFIAASIKKHVSEGERYAKISVMLPDIGDSCRKLHRVFARYDIPYYADRRISLSEHPLCAFVFAFISCYASGCRPQDCDAVISSPFFPAPRADKDAFRNYALRLAGYRGAVRRQPNRQILENTGFDYEAVERVRTTFLKGLDLLRKGGESGMLGSMRRLLSEYGVDEKLAALSEKYSAEYPAAAAFGDRALSGVLSVLDEAEKLSGGMKLADVVKVLKSGFAAMEISLIPPKADAVFVGDIATTANTGSNVVFAARLTGDVPSASSDAALLTDREIDLLERAKLNISPKIKQVNLRKRETVALNICAFRNNLYLSYPSRIGDEESGVSEIISYAKAAFLSPSGAPLAVSDLKRIERTGRALPYYASGKLPAIKQMIGFSARPEIFSALYNVLCRRGFKAEADAAIAPAAHRGINCGRQLYLFSNSISPTALETYFACPWLCFMRQGLKVREREEGDVRAIDTGNFVHSVLEKLAAEINDLTDQSLVERRAGELADAALREPPYSSLSECRSGEFTARALKEEAIKISLGMYEQLANSKFRVSHAERKCEIEIPGKIKIFGRIDRVDECNNLVRIIDYKTGVTDCSPSSYYAGLKLQLPLYLLAATSDGKRPAGAYYFPASVEYKEKRDGVFRLQGFMDGGEEVVTASDKFVLPKEKSAYVEAYLNGRKIDSAMESLQFKRFLEYSLLVAGRGAEEMLSGNIAPSPAADVCKYCKMGGSCNFAAGKDGGARKAPAVKCSQIAEIVAEEKNDG